MIGAAGFRGVGLALLLGWRAMGGAIGGVEASQFANSARGRPASWPGLGHIRT
jgi:hypothetical protein